MIAAAVISVSPSPAVDTSHATQASVPEGYALIEQIVVAVVTVVAIVVVS